MLGVLIQPRLEELDAYTMEGRLRVLDVLLERSDRLHEQQGAAPWATSSAVELARRLHEDAVARARSYLPEAAADGGKPASTVPGAGAQEPRKRVVYYPHPDDPPKG